MNLKEECPLLEQPGCDLSLDFAQLKTTLARLGFTRSEPGAAEAPAELETLLWSSLVSEEQEPFYYSEDASRNRVKISHLSAFLEALVGVNEGAKGPLAAQERAGLIGRFVAGDTGRADYVLSEKDVSAIKLKFQSFALTRRDFLFEQRSSKAQDPYSFRPKLNEESVRMAADRQEGSANGMFARLRQESHNANKFSRLRREQAEREENEKLECTFRPKISARGGKGKSKREEGEDADEPVWEALYGQARVQREVRRDRALQGQEARARAELAKCSFRPATHKKVRSADFSRLSKSFAFTGSEDSSKRMDPFLQRMARAREEKAAVQEAKARGCFLEKVIKEKKQEAASFEYPHKKSQALFSATCSRSDCAPPSSP